MILVLKTGPQSVVIPFSAIYSLSDLITQLGKKRIIIGWVIIIDPMANLGGSWINKK